ncbi:MAG: NADH-quinone oxidoreductase subunit N [Candidatus Zixiibacteriota bacterium]|nr:MAG: NADH-quinone oxidoreductase subunit N [candidate division Zixibacteria bacterium]
MDIRSAAIDFGLITPEIVLLAVAMAVLLLGTVIKSRGLMAFLSFGGLIGGLILAMQQWGHPESGFYGMVLVDNFAIFFSIIFTATGIITIMMSRDYLVARNIERYEFYPLILFSVIGMMLMASSTDLLVIFLGLEIMSVPLYVMAGLARRDPFSNESGIKYFVIGAFASGFLIYGIALIYGAAGTTDLRRILADFSFLKTQSELLLYSGALLVLFSFAFKVAAVPFHMWVPDVYEGAPTPVTAFFSVGPKAAGFAALLRIFIYGFSGFEEMTIIFWLLAVLTMTVGNILAIFQNNVKRMLAYSSIAHAGYILVAVTAGGVGAVSSAVYYLLAYMFFNLGGFAIITIIDSRINSASQVEEMKGLSARHPFLASLLALFMFALAGFPPTAGFMGKFYIFSEAISSGFIWLVIIAVLNSMISVFYYLRVVVAAFFGKPDREFNPVSYSPALIVVLMVTALGTLVLGCFPGYWLSLSQLSMFPII